MEISTREVFGAPCWVSLMTRDLETAQRFYGAVAGWRFRPARLGEAFSVAYLDRVPVAGIGALAADLGVAVAWTPYFAVDDADVAVDRIRERTGTIAVGPVSFDSGGRAALVADPDGAVFGIWEGAVAADWRAGKGPCRPGWNCVPGTPSTRRSSTARCSNGRPSAQGAARSPTRRTRSCCGRTVSPWPA